MQQVVRVNTNKPSTHNTEAQNKGINFVTGPSASTIAAEYGQTSGTLLNKINK